MDSREAYNTYYQLMRLLQTASTDNISDIYLLGNETIEGHRSCATTYFMEGILDTTLTGAVAV